MRLAAHLYHAVLVSHRSKRICPMRSFIEIQMQRCTRPRSGKRTALLFMKRIYVGKKLSDDMSGRNENRRFVFVPAAFCVRRENLAL